MVIETPKGTRRVGPSHPCFIVAELSGNHGHQLDKAMALVEAAAKAGADAVKLQTYTADLLTIDCDNEYFQIKVNDAWKGQTLYSLYKSAYTPWEWHAPLKRHAESLGICLFSTPFGEEAVDFLERLEMSVYKVASFESGHLPLLRKIGGTGKPVILSRGLTPIEEVELAIQTLKEAGASQVGVLHCISDYPAKPHQMNLRTIPDIAERFEVVSGLSDHTLSPYVPIAAIALGAAILEKHITLSRADGGPDAAFSLEPQELTELVRAVRESEAALGAPCYTEADQEGENLVFRRSLFITEAMESGEPFTPKNLRIIRPGYGLAPKYLDNVLGKRATRSIPRGTPLSWDLVQ